MTMKREEAIERLKQNKAAAEFYAGMAQNTNAIENELKDIEAIDMAIEALSERTGEWIWSDEDMSWKCGNCGCVFEEIDWKPEYNFCPNCGARMKGGEDE